ncbi:SDR family NAD(P)-dependent oxidoreductase [Formosa algae]|uniref:NAD(P)-dependent dehydrogenase (Short-subunit alcohol dehydrogenase family) n=1 Tax=Formosa algae TaxID=225843 RepID=A0A9X1CAX0_9FLAO|nr:SDR family oxidoreductase [Formosa algae]MBP1838610.1 NAD(P)-dependent dehydrogenase (short-subunit alcohol dehydrogenase family) [Formosa algae]MDQ0335110.1 NAD(P)-dependent dehydrogenase (short-subunit alcohol dehydrogenase family) [Formosa algae]OEI79556.1 oxidoreductase [Formosa algae]
MRNYIVIGGSSGIGEQIVNVLEAEGSNVNATYHTQAAQDREHVKYISFDAITDTLDLDDLPSEIHGLAYCPGSINLKPFHRFKEEDFVNDFKLQVTGAIKVIQDLLPRLKASGDASLVLFSTVAVQQGFSFHSQVSISKGAIEGLTRALAAELAPTIRVNAIAPSLTDTKLAGRLLSTPEKKENQSKMNPLKKVGDPLDIAKTAQFLLSPNSSWITGQILHVDGGVSAIK